MGDETTGVVGGTISTMALVYCRSVKILSTICCLLGIFFPKCHIVTHMEDLCTCILTRSQVWSFDKCFSVGMVEWEMRPQVW